MSPRVRRALVACWVVGWTLVLLSVFAGCYLPPGEFGDKDGQDDAVPLVMARYGSDARPHVAWAEGVDLDCTVPSNGKLGFSTPDGCMEGWTWNPLYVSVAWRPGDRMADTALPHELAHLALLRKRKVDREHRRPGWWGADGLVQRASNDLYERGL